MFSAAEILRVTDHRPWKLPSGPWIMRQRWSDLLFAHWPISVEQLRPLVPEMLELDTFEGRVYMSITPFILCVQPRGFPPLSQFPEMNCRTYVRFRGKPGIFFFSLDAASRLAVWGARTFYRLPYFYSRMSAVHRGEKIEYSSRRLSQTALFKAEYQPQGPVFNAELGTIQHWLSERYCLYTTSGGQVYRGEIHHVPWPLQEASCRIAENSVAAAAGIQLSETPPLLNFARKLDVLIWPLRKAR